MWRSFNMQGLIHTVVFKVDIDWSQCLKIDTCSVLHTKLLHNYLHDWKWENSSKIHSMVHKKKYIPHVWEGGRTLTYNRGLHYLDGRAGITILKISFLWCRRLWHVVAHGPSCGYIPLPHLPCVLRGAVQRAGLEELRAWQQMNQDQNLNAATGAV